MLVLSSLGPQGLLLASRVQLSKRICFIWLS